MFDETKYHIIRFGRQCYGQVYNSCLKCPRFARIYALRCLRHPSIVPSIQHMVLQFVNAVQLRLMHSLLDVTPYLVINRIKVSAIRQPQTWRNKSGWWLLKKSHKATCPVCRCAVLLKDEVTWQVQTSSWATAAVTGACCGNSRRCSSPLNGQRCCQWG